MGWGLGRLLLFFGCGAILALGAPASAGTTTYTYDAQGRVRSATYTDGTVICYLYDPAGNRLKYTVGTACFAQVTHTYGGPTSGTETVPTGASIVTITMWSGGAAGARDSNNGGGGGGGGCQAVQTVLVTGGNTMTYSVGGTAAGRGTNGIGANGASSSVSGTVSGGHVGLTTSGVAHGGGLSNGIGAGATCSGGTDTAGGVGDGVSGGNGGGVGGGAGGGDMLGSSGTAPGGGGSGALSGTSGTGAAGEITFVYQ